MNQIQTSSSEALTPSPVRTSEQNYLDQLQYILDNGVKREDRTGVGTISCFGMQARYNLQEGFPAVTTKKLVWKSMVSELLWFISGSGNINELKEIYKHNKLWDLNFEDYCQRRGIPISESDGDMGRIYGRQWRHWRRPDGTEVDQLQEAIDLIKNNPTSRRIIVNAWNPGEIDPNEVALPPCHAFFQFYVANGKLSLQMYQRSADMFLGVPLNIASYSLLLAMVAKITDLEPFEFIHTIGDAHIYFDAMEQVALQLTRNPLPQPRLKFANEISKRIEDFSAAEIKLENYQHHPAINASMAI